MYVCTFFKANPMDKRVRVYALRGKINFTFIPNLVNHQPSEQYCVVCSSETDELKRKGITPPKKIVIR
jgi:hypothetical protein